MPCVITCAIPPTRHNGSIVNFRISRNEKTRLYQITSKKSFESIEELIEAYHSHPIKSKEKKVEIYLVEGIPSVDSNAGSDSSLPSPTSPGWCEVGWMGDR